MHSEAGPPSVRLWLAILVAAAAAACADQTGPTPAVVGSPLFETLAPDTLHFLRQDPTAPALETYQTSFWVTKGKATSFVVAYQLQSGQTVGDPFLRFDLTKESIIAGGGGSHLDKGDSVLITLAIDPTTFRVDFGPSGMKFSAKSPAILTMCYEHMDPDLNQDGVVDATDLALEQQLAFWTQSMKAGDWFKLSTKYDPANPCVSAQIFHFSQYAVSW